MKTKIVFFALCFVFSVSAAFAADEENLFLDVGAPQVYTLPEVNRALVMRQRVVSVQLERFAKGEAERIHLNLFNDVNLIAVHDNTEWGPEGGFAWYGHVGNEPQGRVTLVIGDQGLSGTIGHADRTYKVRPVDGSVHVIREIDRSMWVRSGPAGPSLRAAPTSLAIELEVLTLTNQERAELGLHALSWNGDLFTAARGHSEDMAAQDYFSHTSIDGRSPADRIDATGYDWQTWGENIAAGYSTPEAVMNGWMNSDGHRANILQEAFCDLGVGYGFDSSSSYRHYWTQNFGRQRNVWTCPDDNANPEASFSAEPRSGEAPLRVDFDATASFDPDGTISIYTWDFGDGTSGSGVQVLHTYTTAGTYTVRLTVTDDDGASASRTVTDFIVVQSAADGDSDGMPDHEESGPDGNDPEYDGNQDGQPDNIQANVVSGHTFDGKYYVTLSVPDDVQITEFRFAENPSLSDAPAEREFALGFFAFTIGNLPAGGAVTVELHLPDTFFPDAYYKYGPTPDEPVPHWYEFSYNGQTGARIEGHQVGLHLIDGQRGDDDLIDDNGVIVDIGGPATAISTGSEGGSGGGCFIDSSRGPRCE